MANSVVAAGGGRFGPATAYQRQVLSEIEEEFRCSVVGVKSRFLAGLHRPPADFINRELQRRGEAWRVDAPRAN